MRRSVRLFCTMLKFNPPIVREHNFLCTSDRPSPVPCVFVVKKGMKILGSKVGRNTVSVVFNLYTGVVAVLLTSNIDADRAFLLDRFNCVG
jgi:hypothetical protein